MKAIKLLIIFSLMLLFGINFAQVYWTNSNNCNLNIGNNSVITVILNENITNTSTTPCIRIDGRIFNVSLTINLNNRTINKTNDFIWLNNLAANSGEYCQDRNVTIIIQNGTINTSRAVIYQANNVTASQNIRINNVTINSLYFYHGGNGSCGFSPSSFLNGSIVNVRYLFNLSKRGCLNWPYIENNRINVSYIFTSYNASTPYSDSAFDRLCPNAYIRFNNITMADNRLIDILVPFGDVPYSGDRTSITNNNITFIARIPVPYRWSTGQNYTGIGNFFTSSNNIIRNIADLTPTPSTAFLDTLSVIGGWQLYYVNNTNEICIRLNCAVCPLCPRNGVLANGVIKAPFLGYVIMEHSHNPGQPQFYTRYFGTTDVGILNSSLNIVCYDSNNTNITLNISAGYNPTAEGFLGIPSGNSSLFNNIINSYEWFASRNNTFLSCVFFNITNRAVLNNTPFIAFINLSSSTSIVSAVASHANFTASGADIRLTYINYPKYLGFIYNNTPLENVLSDVHTGLNTVPVIFSDYFLGSVISETNISTNRVVGYVQVGGFSYGAWRCGGYWRSAGFVFTETGQLCYTYVEPGGYCTPVASPCVISLPLPETGVYYYRFTIKNAKTNANIEGARITANTVVFTLVDGSATLSLVPNRVYRITITKPGYQTISFYYIPSLQQEITLYMQPIETEGGGSGGGTISYEILIREILANTNYFTTFNKTSRIYRFNWSSTDPKVQYGETRCYNTTGNYYVLYASAFGNGSTNSTSITLPANSSYVCENILFVGYGVAVIKETIAEPRSWTDNLRELALLMAVVIILTIVGAFAYSPIMAVIAGTLTILLLGFTGIIYLPPLAYAGLVIVATLIVLIIIRKSQYWT